MELKEFFGTKDKITIGVPCTESICHNAKEETNWSNEIVTVYMDAIQEASAHYLPDCDVTFKHQQGVHDPMPEDVIELDPLAYLNNELDMRCKRRMIENSIDECKEAAELSVKAFLKQMGLHTKGLKEVELVTCFLTFSRLGIIIYPGTDKAEDITEDILFAEIDGVAMEVLGEHSSSFNEDEAKKPTHPAMQRLMVSARWQVNDGWTTCQHAKLPVYILESNGIEVIETAEYWEDHFDNTRGYSRKGIRQ